MGRRGKRSTPIAGDLDDEMVDYLINIPKISIDPDIPIDFYPGMDVEVDFRGQRPEDKHELFRLVIERFRIKSNHAKFQLMVRRSVILLRLEINGTPHENPDHAKVPCPHIHRHRPGFDDRWAEVPGSEFTHLNDPLASLREFLAYCNLVQVPPIRPVAGLFP